jgi:hypothetical protein
LPADLLIHGLEPHRRVHSDCCACAPLRSSRASDYVRPGQQTDRLEPASTPHRIAARRCPAMARQHADELAVFLTAINRRCGNGPGVG